jgi:hypothetical protein
MAKDYKVLSQAQSVQINPAGTGFENVWEITYKVTTGPASGTVASVTVPAEDHNADAVGAAIEAQIENAHGIASLGQ